MTGSTELGGEHCADPACSDCADREGANR